MSTPMKPAPLALPWPAWVTDRAHPMNSNVLQLSDEELERRHEICHQFWWDNERMSLLNRDWFFAARGPCVESREVRIWVDWAITKRWLDSRHKRRLAARIGARKGQRTREENRKAVAAGRKLA